MPRGFTDIERERINNNLIKTGRELFGRQGIKKTSVEEIARGSGISKGAFYQFYESKEDLYFAVIRAYEEKQHQSILEAVSVETSDVKTQIKEILLNVLRAVDNDPFFKRLIAKDEFSHLWQKFSEDQIKEAMSADIDLAENLMNIWAGENALKVNDPELVTGVFRALFMLLLHKEEIGEAKFPDVIELILDSVLERVIK